MVTVFCQYYLCADYQQFMKMCNLVIFKLLIINNLLNKERVFMRRMNAVLNAWGGDWWPEVRDHGEWQGCKTQKALVIRLRLLQYTIKGDKIWHRPTLPHFTAVPSALAGLTSLFGMGRGGHRRYRHLNIFSSSEC